MRESQMKKIIAVAVAGAFAAPVMAADVTLSGVMDFQYRDASGTTSASYNGDTPAITVAATSETAAGYTVSGSISLDPTVDDASFSVSGAFGKFSIGNPSGALDSVGDYTDIAPEKGGFSLDGQDNFLYFSPNLGLEGVALHLSGNPAATGDGAGASDEGTSVAFSYTMGATQLYAGQERFKGDASAASDTTADVVAYGVKTTIGGIMLAYERGTIQNSGASVTDATLTGMAAKYSMGDVTVGVENQESDVAYMKLEQDGAGSSVSRFDRTTAYVSYNMGGGLSGYVEQSDEDVGGTEQTTIGLKYSF
jgi:hypothetical protein